MKLTRNGIKEHEAWEKIGIKLPGYDVEAVSEKARREPGWVHFGIGNIFRVFIGGIADGLLEEGVLDRGITCVETFDYDVVDKIYEPYDNLGLNVILHGDGTREYKVLGALAEAVKAQSSDPAQWNRLKEIFASKSLQMVSFTITEKGYALQKADGTWFPFVEADIKNGPDKATGAMAVLVAMLYERYKAGKYPLALVSMDNCSQNGAKLRESVLTMTEEWNKAGFVDDDFVKYVSDEKVIAFPWTMIDKITPRPSEQIAADLENLGVEDMQPVITGKKTYIAPFVNAEKPQYLVIEDSFPNGRPALEKGFGVYMADRNTVNLSERMKVTVCLNPVHSATGPLGVVLGYDLFAHMLNTNEDMMKMARMVAYDEGLPVVADPGILSPQAFVDELFNDRFPNEYLGDTNLRLAVDVSQMVGIRFGETVKAYVERFGDASRLTAIPLGIAGWLRYMLAVDDEGNRYELAPDPMNEEIGEQLGDIVIGKPETFKDQLKPILSNERLFFTDLYKAGVGEKIENMFREMIAGPGAVKATIHKYVKGKDGRCKMEMNLKEQLNGIQHVGVPTNDIETTIKFYEALGFEVAFQTVNEAANEKVAFLKLGNLVIETYENKVAKMEAGAIDHVAIDVKDIEKVHEMITAAGLNTTKDTVHFLPFWENGVKFFTIEGPNKEKVEFSQYL